MRVGWEIVPLLYVGSGGAGGTQTSFPRPGLWGRQETKSSGYEEKEQ